MVEAAWKGRRIAKSDATELVEGNHYFPADAVDMARLRPSDHTSVCPWKSTARYFDVVVDGEVNRNAAWVYPETRDAAKHIEGRIAFWKGVAVG